MNRMPCFVYGRRLQYPNRFFQGGTFRQYELTVDGLSYFSMPAVFELGTQRMWKKASSKSIIFGTLRPG